MPRDLRARENQQRARAKRDAALARTEFAYPSVPRVSATGATSAPLKAEDSALRAMIDEALARKR